jgi:biotin-(acetyl-CoA carboxylase) ligase
LRQQIKNIDPAEFERIIIFEKAINEFKQLATTRQFTSITGKNINESCQLALNTNEAVECLVKACDADGNWTIITPEGEIRHFEKSNVAEKPVEIPIH